MFIGHLAGAEVLHAITPTVPWWVLLSGSAFPDLLWGAAVLMGKERVEVSTSPLQKDVKFSSYPISHSLVVGGLVACIPGLVIGQFLGATAALMFVIASILHWVFDSLVHIRDLPIIGFGRDKKVGLGLWKYSRISFALEYSLLLLSTVLFLPMAQWGIVLGLGLAFHLINANAFFGFARNIFRTSKQYAAGALAGFVMLIAVFSYIL